MRMSIRELKEVIREVSEDLSSPVKRVKAAFNAIKELVQDPEFGSDDSDEWDDESRKEEVKRLLTSFAIPASDDLVDDINHAATEFYYAEIGSTGGSTPGEPRDHHNSYVRAMNLIKKTISNVMGYEKGASRGDAEFKEIMDVFERHQDVLDDYRSGAWRKSSDTRAAFLVVAAPVIEDLKELGFSKRQAEELFSRGEQALDPEKKGSFYEEYALKDLRAAAIKLIKMRKK